MSQRGRPLLPGSVAEEAAMEIRATVAEREAVTRLCGRCLHRLHTLDRHICAELDLMQAALTETTKSAA